MDENKQSNFRGTGLGLSICKKIIENMKGEINVQSEVGKGTQFTVKIDSFA